ncbi:hypothetical protein AB835_03250 [Candidatus Endobugula sertula]|uniref:DUF1735 domain-containing protein n=1 Tax=Candidatus Endobugula sertula TaxID=62101 RepID=A0A1D2QSE4_9GAMM|nr:hypothetical protein AB835_03250 [Candidatus Endobugula sertula]
MNNILLFALIVSLPLMQACKEELKPQRVVVADNYTVQLPGYAKPGASVALANSKVTLDVAGAQHAVDVGINSAYDSGTMALSVSASEGLYIVDGDTNPTVSLRKGTIEFPYTIIASQTGRYYIYLNAKVESGGKIEGRALTFIVQVGEESLGTASQKSAIDGNTEVLIPLPAEEDIIY